MGTGCLFDNPRAARRRRNPWVPVGTTARIIPTIVAESAGMQRSGPVRSNRCRHRNRRLCRVLQSISQALSGPASMQPATRDPIYLDHSATTPVWPEVVDAMQEFFADSYGNPSSIHAAGRSAYAGLQKARSSIAAHIGARRRKSSLPGGTEATTALRESRWPAAPTGATHVSSHRAPRRPGDVEAWPTSRLRTGCYCGRCRDDRSSISKGLQEPTALVSCLYANNEVGRVQTWQAGERS